jgi:hypothetical protein
MIKISVQGIRATMSGLEKEKDRVISQIAQDTLEIAKSKTPIDQGQARAGWRLEGAGSLAGITVSATNYRIVNRVPHIVPLENGRSKQAPNGILGPTVREISRRRYK